MSVKSSRLLRKERIAPRGPAGSYAASRAFEADAIRATLKDFCLKQPVLGCDLDGFLGARLAVVPLNIERAIQAAERQADRDSDVGFQLIL